MASTANWPMMMYMIAATAPAAAVLRRTEWLALLIAILAAVQLISTAVHPVHASVILLAAPCLEETVFRAGLQDTLLRRGASMLASNVLTAAAFALAHALVRSDDPFAATLVVPALALGTLYSRTRSLRLCVAAHMAMNIAWWWTFRVDG